MVIQSWVETIWLLLSNLKCEPPSSLMFSPVFPLCCFYPSTCSLPYLDSSRKDPLFCLTLICIPIVACEKFYCSVSLCLFAESCLNSLHICFIIFKLLGTFQTEFFRYSSESLPHPRPPFPGTPCYTCNTVVNWIGCWKIAHRVRLVCTCIFTCPSFCFISNGL